MTIAENMLIETVEQLGGSASRRLAIGGGASLPSRLNDLAGKSSEGETVSWLPTDIREANLAGAGIDVRRDMELPLRLHERFHLVVIPTPGDRDLTRRWLVLAREQLVLEGSVVVAGPNAEGVKSAIADAAAIFGPPRHEAYRQKHRVASFVRSGLQIATPDWETLPGIASGTWQELPILAGDQMLLLATLPGVFAGDRLDAGTELLLDHVDVGTGTRVLDVGCGAGAIGFVARERGAETVDMTDVNLLAIASVERTIRTLGISGVRVFPGDVYDAQEVDRYDLIVSNPPFHHGKAIDFDMPQRLIDEAPHHLLPGGRLLIVANAFLSYRRRMENVFSNVRVVASTRSFHVLEGSIPR